MVNRFSGIDEREVNRQILVESVTFLYRSVPSAALSHSTAAAFAVFALYGAVETHLLLIWFGAVIAISALRVSVNNFVERRLGNTDAASIESWSNLLAALAFVQTAIWGASVFIIWPDDIGYRAFLTALLAGIVAAGGIMLALHKRSFVIYCLPIAIPAVIQLVAGGSRLENILALLLVFYSVLLLFTVNRLTDIFLEGLKLRFLIQTESRTDALTALANRRGFDESLRENWLQSIRSGKPIGLLIIDVDFFKSYNDYYGHPQGDIALQRLGELFLKKAARGTDLCARIGGEEFAILMPATELEGSLQVANAIMEELKYARIPHNNSKDNFLTVSIGLNVIKPTREANPDIFVMETDQALYQAKEAGRNQIAIAGSAQLQQKEAGGRLTYTQKHKY